MKSEYILYSPDLPVTREDLDSICVGDLVKINDWKKPMRVKAVSKNYFVMSSNFFGKPYYAICSKKPFDGKGHYNGIVGGMFYCGPDAWIFGSPLTERYENLYEFNNDEANKQYLKSLEEGETSISTRKSIAIYDLYVKHNRGNK